MRHLSAALAAVPRAGISPGTWWMVAAAASFALMAAGAKMLPGIPTFEKVFARSLFSVVLTLWALRGSLREARPKRPGLLVLRSVFGFAGLACYFEAIERIPLGTAVTIYNTTPLFAGLIGVLFVGERFGRRQAGAILVGLGGIALIRGFGGVTAWEGVAFALGTALLSATAYNVVRLLHASEHPMTIVLAFPLISIPLSLMGGIGGWVMPAGWDWVWLLVLGSGTQGGQVCLTYALQYHTASRATQIGFVGVVFAMLLGIPLGDGVPGLAQIAGAALVFLSLLLHRPPPARAGPSATAR